MYLARKRIKGRIHYLIRESYQDGKYLRSRDLFDLGVNPSRYIVYPGGNAYYINEVVEDSLHSFGVEPTSDELDDIFWRFLNPEIRRAVEHFRRRGTSRRAKLNRAEEEKVRTQVHLLDKRRMHYLKYGSMDQRRIVRTPPKLFGVLLEKSRDEIEQYFMEKERSLEPSELKTYVYVIFDLQRFFTETIATIMPQGLDQRKVDEYFLNEICRLNSNRSFWAGINLEGRLHEYLIRYVIMYFDSEYGRGSFLDDYIRNFMNSRRFYRPPPKKSTVSLDEASAIFGVKQDSLKKMTRRGITRLYRRMAQKLHPDKGGDHEKFIKLTEAYQELLRGKK
ncbi:MAG: J domain-containing protein [Pseudomonadota bacterium]